MESVVFELTEGLNRAGIQTDVMCAHSGARTSTHRAPAGYEITRVGSWGTVASSSICPRMVPLLRQIADRYELMHVHLPNPMVNLAVLLSGFKGRVVLHWHSDIVKQRRAMKFYEPLQFWLLRRADSIISTSSAYADSSRYLADWRHKVVPIPIGIDPSALAVDPEALERLRNKYRGRRIVFALGRLTYYKGFRYLIDAAAHLPDNVAVLIGGSGELAGVLQEQARRKGLAGRVEMLGNIPARDLGAYYALCDVFCLPSIARSEAFGVVMLEAMAFSKPVVATEIPGSGVPWVNQHGVSGLNVPIENSVALAAAIRTLIENEHLRSTLGTGARGRLERHFCAPRMIGSTIDAYEALTHRV